MTDADIEKLEQASALLQQCRKLVEEVQGTEEVLEMIDAVQDQLEEASAAE